MAKTLDALSQKLEEHGRRLDRLEAEIGQGGQEAGLYPLATPSASEIREPGSAYGTLIRDIGAQLTQVEMRLGRISAHFEAETSEILHRLENA